MMAWHKGSKTADFNRKNLNLPPSALINSTPVQSPQTMSRASISSHLLPLSFLLTATLSLGRFLLLTLLARRLQVSLEPRRKAENPGSGRLSRRLTGDSSRSELTKPEPT